MSYKITVADLNSLRYIYSFYVYLEHDIKLSKDIRALLREEAKDLFNKYSGEVLKVATHDDMFWAFEEIIEEFQEDLKKEKRPKKKPTGKKREDADRF
jgi:ribosome-associated translation inhibitor RaiA